jgi:hypothetical protein
MKLLSTPCGKITSQFELSVTKIHIHYQYREERTQTMDDINLIEVNDWQDAF